ncbi:urea ABC transporter permease subunit UrtB [Halovibrio salipaludis]|uniref:Urea ABC transporter permease subunit UrtB n=1 Tax=Halovibrio salipaludis TaxID=2032626 RepID=A0A2A2F852_9GAMM|nr:urea ABC transporter permease subunit UrtB [Halovibrio salipaludis]PAU80775.1 urea ABC transporter permease subunit UrtB [Halovibrio salipaludis]
MRGLSWKGAILLGLLMVPAVVVADTDGMSADERAEKLAEQQKKQTQTRTEGLSGEAASIVERLATDDWQAINDVVEELEALAAPETLPVLQALSDRRLYFDEQGRVLIEDPATGEYSDAITGETVEVASENLSQPTLTNAIRRGIRPLIGQLQLFSDDVATRRAGAEELADRPRPEMLGRLKELRAEESNPEVLRLLNIAIARLQLDASDSEERLEAVEVIADVRSARMKSELESLLETDAQGDPVEPDAAVREAARDAIEAIEERQSTARFLSDLVYGLSMGSVLLLAALGLAIIFGLMRVINMAHGELLMIGAYTTFIVQNLFALMAPQWFSFYLLAAIPAAFVVTALVGILMERGVIRFLYARPLETLLATWGISLILMQTTRVIFGAQNVRMASPEWFSGSVQLMQGVSLSTSRVGVIAFAFFVVALVWFVMNRTRLGLEVRAVMQNREMAAALGVSANRVDMWTFGAGAGVAGLGGVALSQIVNVGPELGQNYIVDSFMVVVLGGVGNILGSVFSALGLGVFSKFLEPVAGAVLAKILLFVAIIVFIQWRPQGIFALKGRAGDDD